MPKRKTGNKSSHLDNLEFTIRIEPKGWRMNLLVRLSIPRPQTHHHWQNQHKFGHPMIPLLLFRHVCVASAIATLTHPKTQNSSFELRRRRKPKISVSDREDDTSCEDLQVGLPLYIIIFCCINRRRRSTQKPKNSHSHPNLGCWKKPKTVSEDS